MWGGPQKERGAVGRTLAVPSRSKDTGPYPEPLPMYGHSFVPVAACVYPRSNAQPIACRLFYCHLPSDSGIRLSWGSSRGHHRPAPA